MNYRSWVLVLQGENSCSCGVEGGLDLGVAGRVERKCEFRFGLVLETCVGRV